MSSSTGSRGQIAQESVLRCEVDVVVLLCGCGSGFRTFLYVVRGFVVRYAPRHRARDGRIARKDEWTWGDWLSIETLVDVCRMS